MRLLAAHFAVWLSLLTVTAIAQSPTVPAKAVVSTEKRVLYDLSGMEVLLEALSSPGQYLLDVKSSGMVEVVPLEIKKIGVVTPEEPGELRDDSRKLAESIGDEETAEKLALALGTLVSFAGDYDDVDRFKAAATAVSDRILSTAELKDRWSPWREALSRRLNKMEEDGDLATVEDFAGAYKELSLGLMDSLPGEQAISWIKVLEVVRLVVPIIKGDEELTLELLLQIVDAVIAIFTGAGYTVSR